MTKDLVKLIDKVDLFLQYVDEVVRNGRIFKNEFGEGEEEQYKAWEDAYEAGTAFWKTLTSLSAILKRIEKEKNKVLFT